MEKNDFWFFALIACFIIALASGWILPAKILVIGCSIIVLIQVAFRLYDIFKKEKKQHASK